MSSILMLTLMLTLTLSLPVTSADKVCSTSLLFTRSTPESAHPHFTMVMLNYVGEYCKVTVAQPSMHVAGRE